MTVAPHRLLVDRSLAHSLTEADLRAWASSQTVFVSGLIVGMELHRGAVAAAVDRIGGRPILFERLGGRDDNAEVAYLDGVRSSDIYLGLLGTRYGTPGPSGYSATHAEYNEAVHHGLRISVWTTTDPVDGPQRDFIDAVRVFHTTGSYSSPDELGAKVEQRLRELAEQAGSPWCKVGHTAFRARRFSDAGPKIVVEADLRDDAVVAALEAFRPGDWGRSSDCRVTCVGRTALVRVESVTVETGPGRVRHVTLTATKTEDRGGSNLLDVGFEGRTPEDLTELAVRVAIFGEPNPLGSMTFFAEMPNPFEALNDLGLAEDAVGGVAEVLLVEELVGSGRASRVTALLVGPKRGGARRVQLAWLPRQRYTSVASEQRSVEGEVRA